MTLDQIDEMTKNDCVFPKKGDPEYHEKWEAYHNRNAEIEVNFRQAVFKDLGIQRNKKRDILFAKAWEQGHSGGYYEVYQCALDLVDLIK